MIAQITGPGLEDADHANLTADKARVMSELLQRFGGGTKEQVVDGLLFGARQRPQRTRQGERQQKVGYGQKQIALFLQPILRSILLALRTVAIAARVVAVPTFTTVDAVVEVTAQRLGPALLNGAHGRQVAGQHAWSVLLSIGWPIFTEDVGQFDYINPATMRLMASLAVISAGRVTWV